MRVWWEWDSIRPREYVCGSASIPDDVRATAEQLRLVALHAVVDVADAVLEAGPQRLRDGCGREQPVTSEAHSYLGEHRAGSGPVYGVYSGQDMQELEILQ